VIRFGDGKKAEGPPAKKGTPERYERIRTLDLWRKYL